MNNSILYGDYAKIGLAKAVEVCEKLTQGSTVILDDRAITEDYNGFTFYETCSNFVYDSRSKDTLSEELRSSIGPIVFVNDCNDCSLRLGETGLWISWGMINYKATALANNMDIEFEDVEIECKNEFSDSVAEELDQLKKANEELKTQVEKLQKQVELMKQILTLDAESIRGSIWFKEGYKCVVVQAATNEYLLVDMLSYNRYYNEKFRKETIVSSLVEKGWELVAKGEN